MQKHSYLPRSLSISPYVAREVRLHFRPNCHQLLFAVLVTNPPTRLISVISPSGSGSSNNEDESADCSRYQAKVFSIPELHSRPGGLMSGAFPASLKQPSAHALALQRQVSNSIEVEAGIGTLIRHALRPPCAAGKPLKLVLMDEISNVPAGLSCSSCRHRSRLIFYFAIIALGTRICETTKADGSSADAAEPRLHV